jgi:hypothetical protein
MHEGLGAGDGGFIIAHQSAVMQQPAEGALHDPAAGEDLKAAHIIRAFYHLHLQFTAAGFDPAGKASPGITAVDPQGAAAR